MAVLHYDPDSHKLINFRIRGISYFFKSIRDVLRFCNETGTIVLRMFGGIGWIGKILWNPLGNTARKFGKYCTKVGNIL